jgi:hypothetical protein
VVDEETVAGCFPLKVVVSFLVENLKDIGVEVLPLVVVIFLCVVVLVPLVEVLTFVVVVRPLVVVR